MLSRRALQIGVAFVSLAPIYLGISGFLNGATSYPEVSGATLDSNLRFLFALMIGFGVSFFVILPNIERQTAVFRVLLGALFLGGVGRLISLQLVGAPGTLQLIVTAIELGAPIIFIPWQALVARSTAV